MQFQKANLGCTLSYFSVQEKMRDKPSFRSGIREYVHVREKQALQDGLQSTCDYLLPIDNQIYQLLAWMDGRDQELMEEFHHLYTYHYQNLPNIKSTKFLLVSQGKQ